jgi:hypothetical protein
VAYHGFSAMAVTKNTTILVLLQRNHYFMQKPMAAKYHHHELFLRLPSLLPPSGRLPARGTPTKRQRIAGPR